jgi:hypothetical protein
MEGWDGKGKGIGKTEGAWEGKVQTQGWQSLTVAWAIKRQAELSRSRSLLASI